MGCDSAVAAGAWDGTWPAAHDGLAIGGERAVLPGAERLSVAAAAEGLSALHDGATLFLSVARPRPVAADQPRAGDGGARAGRPRGEPLGRRDRQPVGEDDGSRRPTRVRCGQEGQGPQAPYAA